MCQYRHAYSTRDSSSQKFLGVFQSRYNGTYETMFEVRVPQKRRKLETEAMDDGANPSTRNFVPSASHRRRSKDFLSQFRPTILLDRQPNLETGELRNQTPCLTKNPRPLILKRRTPRKLALLNSLNPPNGNFPRRRRRRRRTTVAIIFNFLTSYPCSRHSSGRSTASIN